MTQRHAPAHARARHPGRGRSGALPAGGPAGRARDFAEFQERQLTPLYEAVYERLEVGPGTRLLGVGPGAGPALRLAADGRGAEVAAAPPRAAAGPPAPYDVITAFEPPSRAELAAAVAHAAPGAVVVLAGWGPAERCATAAALRVAGRLADPAAPGWTPPGRDDLEDLARAAGLLPDGSGRVACPFGYPDLDAAVRGLLATGWFDAAIRATDPAQVVKELAEAVHPYRLADGTVWMPNVFRYVLARAPRRRARPPGAAAVTAAS